MYGVMRGIRRQLVFDDVLREGQTTPASLGDDLTVAGALRAGSGFSSNGALRVGTNSGNEAVTINFQNSAIPTTSRFLVADEVDTNYVLADVSLTVTEPSVSADTGALRATIQTSAAGAIGMRAGEFHTKRFAGATNAGSWVLELGLHSEEAGNGVTENVGIMLLSSHSGWTPTGVRNDTGIYIGGEDGWVWPILCVETDGTTLLFGISQTGAVTMADVLTIGASASTTGQIRLPTTTGLKYRNAANSGDLDLIRSDASDNVLVGALTGAGGGYLLGTTGVTLQVGLNVEVTADTVGIKVGRSGGTLGYFGAVGTLKQTLPAAAADPATTQALANAIRTMLIGHGMAA